jgi:hypothetical protein
MNGSCPGLTLHSPPNGEGSTSSHPVPRGDAAEGGKSTTQQYPCRIRVRRCLISAGQAAKVVPTSSVLGPCVPALGTGLGGVRRGDPDQPTTLGCSFVREEPLNSAPRHPEDCTVQPGLGPDVPARAGRSTTRRAGHPSDVQVLDHDRAVAPGDLSRSLVNPVRASTSLASPQRGDLAIRLTLPMRLWAATPPGSAPPCRLAFKRSQSARFSAAQEARHVEVSPVREGHRVYDAEVDPDDGVLTRCDGDSPLLDAKADVPAERILQQSGTGDTPFAPVIGSRYGARPPEPHSSDQQDRDLAPAAIHPDDSKVGRLRVVDRHPTSPMLESRRTRQPLEIPIPGAQVMPKHLLAGLCWQLRQPLPPGQRAGAGVAKLAIHLLGRRALGDAAAPPTPTVPLVEEIPESAGRVSLAIQLLDLGRSGIEPGHMCPVSSLCAAALHHRRLPCSRCSTRV